MKELTIQEKAKRYDEAIKLVNSKWYYRNQPCFINVSELFPEFKENKSKNIRKWLIEYFQEYKSTGIEGFANGLKIDSIVDWLERQGEQESINKIELKFKVGDWIIQENIGVYKVIEICKSWYEVINTEDNHYSISFDKEYMYHLWSIEDAKEGDVISYKDEILLYKHTIKDYSKHQQINFGGFVYDCCYDGKKFIRNGIYSLIEQDKIDIHPATKEQRDLLFTEMKQAGYRWDENKKELIKLQDIDETYKPKYCYILSYGLGKVFEHFITEDEVNLTTEEILKKHGFNEDECSVMYSTDKLNLEPLED